MAGRREGDYRQYLPLCRAVRDGDVENTKKFLDTHPEATRAAITETGETAIFLATLHGHVKIAELLLQSTTMNDLLKMTGEDGFTPLHVAVAVGSTEIVTLIAKRYPNLLLYPTKNNHIPVVLAANTENKAMVRYLYRMTPIGDLDQHHRADILRALIIHGNYGKVE